MTENTEQKEEFSKTGPVSKEPLLAASTEKESFSNTLPSSNSNEPTQISNRLLQAKTTSTSLDSSIHHCDFNEGEPFNGIFAYLTKKNSGNPHTKGCIYISASSTLGNHPWQVIDPGWTSHWVSDNAPDQWIRFDFKTARVILTYYTLKTYNYVAGGNHMKSWVVEGSSSDNDWLEIDRRQSTNDLNDKFAVKTFKCKNSSSFRYYRIRQTGKTHCESDMMALTSVEFFGTYRDE